MDEVQYQLHRSLLPVKVFFNKEAHEKYEADLKEWKESGGDKSTKPVNPNEQEAEEFVKNYEGEDQLGDIGHLDNGVYYVTLPNVLSKAIDKGIKQACEQWKMNVPLGFAFISGKNWLIIGPFTSDSKIVSRKIGET